MTGVCPALRNASTRYFHASVWCSRRWAWIIGIYMGDAAEDVDHRIDSVGTRGG